MSLFSQYLPNTEPLLRAGLLVYCEVRPCILSALSAAVNLCI